MGLDFIKGNKMEINFKEIHIKIKDELIKINKTEKQYSISSIKSIDKWKPSELVTIDKENMTEIQYKTLLNLIDKYSDIFSKNDKDIGKAKFLHDIKLISMESVHSRANRVPYVQKKIIEEHIENMLENGIINKSQSSYTSPIVLVKKPGQGEHRFCVDFRKLNAITL